MDHTRAITLVSMAPSGETFIARDRSGRLWLYQPEGAGGAGPIDEALAERAVADHGFDHVDRGFATWADLDQFRQEQAARVTPDVMIDRDGFDRHDVERLLGVAKRWIARGEGHLARRLVTELLRVPAVRSDPELLDKLVSVVEELASRR